MATTVQADVQDAQSEREVSRLKQVDGKLVARYEIREKATDDNWDWTDYEKIFDTFEQFTTYTSDFFKLDQ